MYSNSLVRAFHQVITLVLPVIRPSKFYQHKLRQALNFFITG